MKRFLLPMVCSVLLLASCSKEASTEQDQDNPTPIDTSGNNNANKKLLTRVVQYEEDYPEDSSVINFYYNANKKLIRQNEFWYSTTMDNESFDYFIYRGADDIIQRMSIIDSHYEGTVFKHKDSSVYDVVYDHISKHYKYVIHTANFEYIGTPYFIRDSIIYTYNNKDQIVVMQILRRDEVSGTYFEAERREHDFDSKGNIIKLRYNENYDNQGEPLREDIMEYDDKINPHNFGMDGLLFGMYSFSWPTPNNPRKFSGDEAREYFYTYDIDNYPVFMEDRSPDPGKTYFYYK